MKGLVEPVRPVWNDSSRRAGLIPHDQPIGHLVVVLPAFCPQIAPSGPFLPVMPVRKYCAVYILRFDLLHGMEEVIGSIPIRSTNNHIKNQQVTDMHPLGTDVIWCHLVSNRLSPDFAAPSRWRDVLFLIRLVRSRLVARPGIPLASQLVVDRVECGRHTLGDYLHILVGRGGCAHVPK